jgi:branched-chain amino acid aminotransferase
VPVTRVNERILCNDAPGPMSEKITQTYWDWHERGALTEAIDYKS